MEPGLRAQHEEFTSFVRSDYERVYRAAFVFLGGDRQGAEDAAQEAFSRAYARWSRLRGKDNLLGWTIVTCINICKRSTRRRRFFSSEDPTQIAVSNGDVDDRVDLVAALQSLPERQRQVAVLHYVGGYTQAAVAELLGLSEGTIKSHLFRARTAVRRKLELESEGPKFPRVSADEEAYRVE